MAAFPDYPSHDDWRFCDCCEPGYYAIKMRKGEDDPIDTIVKPPSTGPEFNNKKGGRRKYPRR